MCGGPWHSQPPRPSRTINETFLPCPSLVPPFAPLCLLALGAEDGQPPHTFYDITPEANTVYARANFSISRTNCYTELVLYYFPANGLAVYLNGAEAFRFNLPRGALTSSTTVSTLCFCLLLQWSTLCVTVFSSTQELFVTVFFSVEVPLCYCLFLHRGCSCPVEHSARSCVRNVCAPV